MTIAVSVMVISLLIGLANYLRFLDKQRLYQAGANVEIMLKDGRSKAQNGYLGSEELGYCTQLAGVEISSATDVSGRISIIGRLSCADDSSLIYESFTLEQAEVAIDQHFQIIFLPSRGARLTLGGATTSSGAAVLSQRDSAVIFNLDQGGTIDVSYQ